MKQFLTLCFLLINSLIFSQIYIIPQPKEIVEVSKDSFDLSIPIKVLKEKSLKINPELLKVWPFSSVQNDAKTTNSLEINLFESHEDLKDALVKDILSSSIPENNEAYVLSIKANKIQIYAIHESGIFYALQTLIQIKNNFRSTGNIPCLSIYDWPDISVRAWQDDISRGPIPSMETLKKEISLMSGYKLNHFTLYIEHVFILDQHPLIAPKDGISKSQLAELIEYAADYHVKLIGSYQSFGHMRRTLSNENYAHLRENDHTITPALEESYQFLDEVYSEIVPSFNADFFNINCDETGGLGEGKAKTMIDTMGMEGVYAYHINRLNDLLKKYDKKILMWGDIAANHPEITKNLPKNITVIPWAYHDAESFDYAIEPISSQGLDFWVAPGISCWGNIFPDMHRTKINNYNLIRDGYKLGATGVLNTSWDDDGLNFFNNNWHGFAWGSEVSWNAPKNVPKEESDRLLEERYNHFNKGFDIQFYGINPESDVSLTKGMLEFSDLHQSGIYHSLKNERFLEPIFPIHLDYVKTGEKEKNEAILEKVSVLWEELAAQVTQVTSNFETLPYLFFALDQSIFLSKKNIFRINLFQYLNGDQTVSVAELKSSRDDLLKKLSDLKERYIKLWNTENRPHWLKENMDKFDLLSEQLAKVGDHVLIEVSVGQNEEGRQVVLRSVFGDQPIYYTLNGTDPVSTSMKYVKPFYVQGPVHIKASTISGRNPSEVAEKELISHKAIGTLAKVNTAYSSYHPSYDGGGKYALVDGVLGDKSNIRSRKWQAYGGNDIDVELKFDGNEVLNSFSMGFFQNTLSWVIFPKQVEIYIKDKKDDEYQLYKIIESDTSPEEKGAIKKQYEADLGGISPLYMKIVARNYGDLPDWHPAGSGNPSMLFADEIIIE